MPILERLPENVKGRDFVVGDLHGSYEELCVELESHHFDRHADRLIAVGDLIDRGQSSFQCLRLTEEPWFFTVWGNHESLMLRGLRERPGSDEFRLWMQNGGEWALERDLDELRTLITELADIVPLAIELPVKGKTIGVVHAEVPGDDWATWSQPLTKEQKGVAIWSRTALLGALAGREPAPVRGIDYVIFGHTPIAAPARVGNRIYLDTGGGYSNGRPTLVEIDPDRLGCIDTCPSLFSPTR
ncbi:MAG: metallophosphoesterase [Marinobacter sp.]|uniref:metallophosphoesterase n=1 Tax=Marinobacter sp. TaxID=50741 RepID=UPI00396DB773